MNPDIKRQIANAIQDMSVGRCNIVGYHKVYAVSPSAAAEIADYIVALIDSEESESPA